MQLTGAEVLVTGANRGIGQAFVEALLARGAAVVHAVGRDIEQLEVLSAIDRDRVRPLTLDVTDTFAIDEMAAATERLDLLINNAGVPCDADVLADDSVAELRRAMEVNYFGTLNMCRAFAPALAEAGGGAIINMGAMAGLLGDDAVGFRAAAAAQLALGQGLREALAGQRTRLIQVLAGRVDSGRAHSTPGGPAVAPSQVAEAVLDALAGDDDLVLPDPFAQHSYRALVADPEAAVKAPVALHRRLVEQLSHQRT